MCFGGVFLGLDWVVVLGMRNPLYALGISKVLDVHYGRVGTRHVEIRGLVCRKKTLGKGRFQKKQESCIKKNTKGKKENVEQMQASSSKGATPGLRLPYKELGPRATEELLAKHAVKVGLWEKVFREVLLN